MVHDEVKPKVGFVIAETPVSECADQPLGEAPPVWSRKREWPKLRDPGVGTQFHVECRRDRYDLAAPGADFSGTAASVGATVTGFAVGDEVFGSTYEAGYGAFSEYVRSSCEPARPSP